MKLNRLAVLVAASLLLASTAHAQEKKKLYRYVDKDGKVTYVDALPADAADAARREFSAKSGQSTGSIDRALTVDERAAAAAAQDQAAKTAAAAAQQKLLEESMLVNYQTEDDLRRAYDERIGLLKQTIESTDISLKNVRSSLASILSEASEAELYGRKVDKRRAGMIRDLRGEMIQQQVFQGNRLSELSTLNAEFDRVLARFRELRAANPAAPAATPATTPAPATTPGGSH
jgi:hypothetical protein